MKKRDKIATFDRLAVRLRLQEYVDLSSYQYFSFLPGFGKKTLKPRPILVNTLLACKNKVNLIFYFLKLSAIK